MDKKFTLPLFIVLCALSNLRPAAAQYGDRDIDLRAGLGISHLRQENCLLILEELEFNAELTDYLAIAPSLMLTSEGKAEEILPDFFQANLNLFLSPFGNKRRNDFRIGSGLSFYKRGYPNTARSAFGINLVLEDTFMLTNRFFIGFKALFQPYFNSNIHSGFLLKAGIDL